MMFGSGSTSPSTSKKSMTFGSGTASPSTSKTSMMFGSGQPGGVNIGEIIPQNFNDDYYEDIMKELFETKIEKVKFCKIVRIIADKLIDAKRTSTSDILQAAIISSNRFPGLQGKNGIPHRRIEIRLKTCLKNKRNRTKQIMHENKGKKTNENSNDCDEQTLEINLEMLIEEFGKTPINVSKMKKLLEKTRNLRTSEAKTKTAKQMLEKYPILQETKFLLWEFGQIVNLSENIMKNNLTNALPKLLAILPNVDDESVTEMMFLKKIDFFFPSAKKKSIRKKRKIVEILKESDGESISDVPTTDKAPYLIIFDDNDETVKCYVDAEPLFVEKPVDAILLLLATYWVFDIDFDKDFHQQTLLLCLIVFVEHAQRILGPYGIESITVNNILSKAGL
ncbi:uncharacterized protein LOC122499118 isoform X2 [Leptopilina heterotoma]|uniref:uncharacterized protein LOC122499118 isoform X2 n=1 Tax=Leptopilina heterotoma TaxID=63436 RepID=UPI001CA7CC71|nr:uncharacterized protein LOC122499118 isoform X2 [Leptopilina heterotoma]